MTFLIKHKQCKHFKKRIFHSDVSGRMLECKTERVFKDGNREIDVKRCMHCGAVQDFKTKVAEGQTLIVYCYISDGYHTSQDVLQRLYKL